MKNNNNLSAKRSFNAVVFQHVVRSFSVAVLLLATSTGCKDYLTAPEPGVQQLDDYFISADAAKANVTGCYTPLMWEFNRTYCCEWFIGDIASDDALKGGQNTLDMGNVYDIENWKTTSNNDLLLDFYQAQYQGIGRCNLALKYIEPMKEDTVLTSRLKNRFLGEAHFLRGYYYFRLLRVFGGTPLVTKVLETAAEWQQPRASVQSVFEQMIRDFEFASANLWLKSEYASSDLGRATKGAAQAMLLKTYLYMASPYWNKQLSGSAEEYAKKAVLYGDSVMASNEYSLCAKYADNFTLEGENGPESVFEIQYSAEPWGDYNEGFGFTSGTFTTRLVRSRSAVISRCNDAGWGFDHPTQNLYNEFEAKDTVRRATAILGPDPAEMENATEEIYLGSAYLNNKYGLYGVRLDHDTRGPLNNKQIRYADVLLMTAEARLIAGEGDAKELIDKVRERAGLEGTTEGDLTKALRHERRVELAMEGHRWFDIVRWGNAKAVMDAYKTTETEEAQSHMATFIEGKHEIFPIPVEEIELNPMEQNPGY